MSRVSEVASEVEKWALENEDGERRKMPLVFPSKTEEITLLATKALVDLGSGFEEIVKKECQRDFKETALFGVMHMHISGKPIDAEFMAGINSFSVIQHFSLKGATREEEIMGGVFKTVDGPLMPLANLIVKCLKETGEKLLELGQPSIGSYIVAKLDDGLSPLELVTDLVQTFPAFRDLGEEDEILGRKAVLLARDLFDLIQENPECEDYRPTFVGIEELPPVVDSDIVRALWKAEAMLLPEETFMDRLGTSPALEVDLSTEDEHHQEQAIRSAADKAMRQILSSVQKNEEGVGISSSRLESYLRQTYLGLGTPKLLIRGTEHY